MITDEQIKTAFIHNIVTRDINIIYQTQANVISQNLEIRTGTLHNFLLIRPFHINEGSYSRTFYMSVLPYLRFLDIRYRENHTLRRNLALYNRVIWGILYNETLPDIRYGLSQEIRKKIKDQLITMAPQNQSS